jgi:capsular polysaccharide transport system permease protein
MERERFDTGCEITITMNRFFRAVAVKSRIINALFIHALISEHGKSKVGYLTAIIKQLGQIIMLTAMFSVLGRNPPIGDDLVLFLATGIIPYNLCMGLANKMLLINKSHRAILTSTPATPFDISIAFLLSETVIILISAMIILAGLGHFGYWDYRVDSLIGILLISITSITIGYGIGLLNMSITVIIPSYEKVWKILSMPLFLMSGVFFVADQRFPAEVISILKYNPLLHVIESTRDSFYRSWESTLFDISYILSFAISVLLAGLLMQKLTQARQRA